MSATPGTWMQRLLLAIIAGPFALLTILAITLALTSGQQWKQVQSDLLARGEKLTFAEVVGPDLPASENFFAAPLWQDTFDLVRTDNSGWQPRKKPSEHATSALFYAQTSRGPEFIPPLITIHRETSDAAALHATATSMAKAGIFDAVPENPARAILDLLDNAREQWTALDEIARRPHARAPIAIADLSRPIPHLSDLTKIFKILRLRLAAERAEGRAEDAYRTTRLMLRLAQHSMAEPSLIGCLIGTSCIGFGLDAIKAGVRANAWDDTQLAELDAALGEIDLYPMAARAFRGERALFNGTLDAIIRDGTLETFQRIQNAPAEEPSLHSDLSAAMVDMAYKTCLLDGDRAVVNEQLQQPIDMLSDGLTAAELSDDAKIGASVRTFPNRLRYPLAALTLGIWGDGVLRVAETAVRIDQTRIAIALQRCKLEHGGYPAALSSLVPAFIDPLPPDPFASEPMRHAVRDDGTFDLWSVGPDQVDESGVSGREKYRNARRGDWPW
jgi:hypothetical protein